MDCLDRTNVVQSACGREALESQLKAEGLQIDLQTDISTSWFNTLWADNGDAISRQYSSTAALKGDFTRTRKRTALGALSDFSLTLTRYFNNIIGDYFTQAAIDYLLGNVTSQVFEEFEANMMTNDPSVSMRKIRQNAIETSSKIVIADETESLIGGWTLLTPHVENSIRTYPFEECIMLLTDAALYAVRFDWSNEKVSSFERVNLRHVDTIYYGTYITSTLTSGYTDEKKNVGFVVTYRPGKDDIARVNTRSLESQVPAEDDINAVVPDKNESTEAAATHNKAKSKSDPTSLVKEANDKSSRLLAFKALPATSSVATIDGEHSDMREAGELDLIKSICEEVERACSAGQIVSRTDNNLFVEERSIISLADAKKSTGYLEQIGYSLKRLVWA
jgi:Inositol phosphatase